MGQPSLGCHRYQSNGRVGRLVTPLLNSGRRRSRPYNGAALSPSDAAPRTGTVFCRECGRSIEADAHFCRFCGKSQADPVAGPPSAPSHPGPSGTGLEHWLRQLFPRHHLQDELMHIGTIAAFLMALIGFVLGFFLAYSWLGTNFLLGSPAILLTPVTFPPGALTSPSGVGPDSALWPLRRHVGPTTALLRSIKPRL